MAVIAGGGAAGGLLLMIVVIATVVTVKRKANRYVNSIVIHCFSAWVSFSSGKNKLSPLIVIIAQNHELLIAEISFRIRCGWN